MKQRIGFYPYTYARVMAMKGSLIPRNEYAKLLKMRVGEIAKYLQDNQYRQEIDQLAPTHQGVDLLESALVLNLEKTLAKLRRISDSGLLLLLNTYLKRWDVHNLKTILRAKHTQTPSAEVKGTLVHLGEKSYDTLLEEESVADVLSKIARSDLASLYTKEGMFALENALDHEYYEELLDLAQSLGGQGTVFAHFLKREIDITNIMTLIRMKQQGTPAKDIEPHLFLGAKMQKKHVEHMLKQENVEDMLSYLDKQGIAKNVAGEQLATLELELRRRLYEESLLLLHKNPLTVDVILAFVFAKDVEIENLRMIIKGKQLGLTEEMISRGLVMEEAHA